MLLQLLSHTWVRTCIILKTTSRSWILWTLANWAVNVIAYLYVRVISSITFEPLRNYRDVYVRRAYYIIGRMPARTEFANSSTTGVEEPADSSQPRTICLPFAIHTRSVSSFPFFFLSFSVSLFLCQYFFVPRLGSVSHANTRLPRRPVVLASGTHGISGNAIHRQTEITHTRSTSQCDFLFDFSFFFFSF